jgi:hypothetical protein
MKTRENFYKICFLNQFGGYLQKFKKNQKRKKRKEKEKKKKAAGNDSAWSQKRPTAQLDRTPNRYLPPN